MRLADRLGHVTTASRIMLPTYVVFFAGLGLNYTLDTRSAHDTPALAFADALMPLPAWGALFLVCSALMALALVARRRLLYRFALRACAASMAIWAVVIILASLAGQATPLAAIWASFITLACVATDRSLAAGEV